MAVDYATPSPSAPDTRFDYFWNQQGEWVEEPNVRRGGESGVQRLHSANGQLLYAKRQVGHTYRSLRHPMGRPTVLRERDALQSLAALGVGVPKLVFCGAQRDTQGQWRALLVTEALDGFQEIDQWYESHDRAHYGEALHEAILKQLADTLARMHKGRWQHSCLYAKHIFLRVVGEGAAAQPEIATLDLEKCRQRFSAQSAARHDLKQLRRHSSFSDADWSKLLYFYKTAFGSPIKGLES